jgi:alcohol dehydrogenase, propanol-preferring
MTRRKGTCVFVGLPPGDITLPLFDIVLKRLTLRGSLVGTRFDLAQAFSAALEFNVRSKISTKPLEDVNVALDQLRSGEAEGRVVLTM